MAAHAKISELKNRLSHYLHLVRQGEPVLVLDRDRVIARIEPAGGPEEADSGSLDELERRGVIRRRKAGQPSRRWLQSRPALKADMLQALLDERAESR